jgi:hypothetical protein
MTTYQEYLNYIKERRKEDKDYYSSEDYKKIYIIMNKLYKEEGHYDKRRKNISNKRKARKQIKEDSFKYGVPIGLF